MNSLKILVIYIRTYVCPVITAAVKINFSNFIVSVSKRASRDEINFLFSKNRMAAENEDQISNKVGLSDFTQSAKKVLKVVYLNLIVEEKSLTGLKLELEKAYDVDQNLHHYEITEHEFGILMDYVKSK